MDQRSFVLQHQDSFWSRIGSNQLAERVYGWPVPWCSRSTGRWSNCSPFLHVQYEAAQALNALSRVLTPSLARDLLPDVCRAVVSSRLAVRKRAVLVLHHFLRADPDTAPHSAFKPLVDSLNVSGPLADPTMGWHWLCRCVAATLICCATAAVLLAHVCQSVARL